MLDHQGITMCVYHLLQVYRVRTKWKFALKDGIMNLKGYDYIFTKTTGEADW